MQIKNFDFQGCFGLVSKTKKLRRIIPILCTCIFLFNTLDIKAQITSCTLNDFQNPVDTRNVIIDPDFDNGNFSSFTHDNNYIEGFRNNRNYSEPGELFVTDDTRKLNNVFSSYRGYGGSGNFLAIDGASTLPNMFWGQSMTFTQNKWYYFEIYVMTIYDNTPNDTSDLANFQFKINDGLNTFNFANEFKTPNNPGVWTLYKDSVFYTGPSGQLDLQIWNTSGGNFSSGNDFAIDRLYLREGCDLAGVAVTTPQPKLDKEINICNGVGTVSLADFGISCTQPNLSILWSNGDQNCNTQVKAGEELVLCIQTLGSCIKSDLTLLNNEYNIEIGEDRTFCQPFSTQITAQISGSLTNRTINYKWYKDGSLINNQTDPSITVSSGGTYVLEANDNICSAKRDTITITEIIPAQVTIMQPSVADTFFTTKNSINNMEVSTSGTGYDQNWVILSGQGTLSNLTSLSTSLSGLTSNEPEPNTLVGTSTIVVSSQDIDKVCPIARDTIVIVKKLISTPIIKDTTLCAENLPFQLTGNQPISKRFETNTLIDIDNALGLGNSHSIFSNQLTISDVNLKGDYNFRYEFYNSVADSTSIDLATITIVPPPSKANAGLDQEICADSIQLNAETPTTGTGSWKCDIGNLKNPSSANSILNDLQENDIALCIWTTENGLCKSSSDTVKIKRLLATKWVKDVDGIPVFLCPNEKFELDVIATGENITYQWYKNNQVISLANDSAFKISSVSIADTGEYYVEAIGKCGIIESKKIKLSVGKATIVTNEPTDVSICKKEAASFIVSADGENLSYQWYHNNKILTDSTSPVLSINSTLLSDSGQYSVIVKGKCGSDTSRIAFLRISDTKFPKVTLSADKLIVCKGEDVKFSASTFFPGIAPNFLFRNTIGSIIFQNSLDSIFTFIGLDSNLTIIVEMTSNATCIDPSAENPVFDTIAIQVINPAEVSIFRPTDQDTFYTTEEVVEDIEMTTLGANYDNSWTKISGQGVLTETQRLSTDLSHLTVNEPEPNTGIGTSVISAISQDLNKICPEANDTLNIVKKGISAPQISDVVLCASQELPYIYLGNEVMSKQFETSNFIDINNILGQGENAIISGNQINITNKSLEGMYNISYEMYNSISDKTLSDNAIITIYQDPSKADAGEDQETCLKSVKLNGNTPSTGSGKWTCDIGTLDNETSPTATLSGLSGNSLASCIWTTSNGTCPDSKDTVKIKKVGDVTDPIIMIADTNVSDKTLNICIAEIPKLAGAFPNPAMGESAEWTSSGTSVQSVSGNTPDFGNLSLITDGTSSVTWTISSTVPGCEPVSRSVIINVFKEPIAEITNINIKDTCSNIDKISITTKAFNTYDSGIWTSSLKPNGGLIDWTVAGTSLQNGDNILTWKVSNPACPTKEVSELIHIDPVVNPTIDLEPLAKKCEGDNADFLAKTTFADDGEKKGIFIWKYDNLVLTDAVQANYTRSNLQAGVRWMTVSLESAYRCAIPKIVSDSVLVTVLPKPEPVVITPDTLICVTDSVNIFGANLSSDTNRIVYQWFRDNFSIGDAMIDSIKPLLETRISGVYTLSANNFVCPIAESSNSMTLEVRQVPQVDASSDGIDPIIIQEGTYRNLMGFHTGTESNWTSEAYLGNIFDASAILNPSDPKTEINTENSGKYKLILTSIDGPCVNSDVVFLQIRSPIQAPNVFTVNGDGVNETFKIKGLETYDYSIVSIYNRWGTLVYESENYVSEEWNGGTVPDGVYFYVIQTDPKHKEIGQSGCIHLVR